jgi:hypothetical protein
VHLRMVEEYGVWMENGSLMRSLLAPSASKPSLAENGLPPVCTSAVHSRGRRRNAKLAQVIQTARGRGAPENRH